MKIEELKTLVENKLRTTKEERNRLFAEGNIEMVEKTDIEIEGIEKILNKLNS